MVPSPPISLCPEQPLPPAFPPESMSMSRTYKFFGLSISYTILTPAVCFLPTIHAPYSLYLFPHFPPSPSPLITLHVISISVIPFLF